MFAASGEARGNIHARHERFSRAEHERAAQLHAAEGVFSSRPMSKLSSAFFAASAALLIPLSSFAQSPAAPAASATPDPASAIRTPPAPAAPRINGPRIYGARPGHPFFYHLPVTGQRPITVTGKGLPVGLTLDSATGNITGSVAKAGTYPVVFAATNGAGTGTARLLIVIGKTICLTPPMGWNSWNCFQTRIDEAKIRGAADAMVTSGLIDHGWTYINMDDRWEGQREAAGNILSSAKIPNMKGVVDAIHAKGLKVGLYSSPGPLTCANAVGSYMHEDQDAATYAAWGIDYLKYDWCSYAGIAELLREDRYAGLLPMDKSVELKALAMEHAVLQMRRYGQDPLALPQTDALKEMEARSAGFARSQILERDKVVSARLGALHAEAGTANPGRAAAIEVEMDQAPYIKMRGSLDKVNRDIVYSFCQYGMSKVWEWGEMTGGNLWRTTGDISADWKSVESHGFNQNGLERWAGPGHWNDPDMLEVGNGKLTPDENYTHMTLWCMLSAPLLIGCDMPKMSPFIVSLFSNDEVLAVNQDMLGRQGWRAKQSGQQEVWVKPLVDGSVAVAFFNRADVPADVSVEWADLKLTGPRTVRDLWRQKDLGVQETGYSVKVAAHGAELFKVGRK
jgi:alpha-galactosidase